MIKIKEVKIFGKGTATHCLVSSMNDNLIDSTYFVVHLFDSNGNQIESITIPLKGADYKNWSGSNQEAISFVLAKSEIEMSGEIEIVGKTLEELQELFKNKLSSYTLEFSTLIGAAVTINGTSNSNLNAIIQTIKNVRNITIGKIEALVDLDDAATFEFSMPVIESLRTQLKSFI